MTTLLIITIILLVFTIIGLIAFIAVMGLQLYSSWISTVPLVPTRQTALKSITEALALYPGAILYDLGSGDGRVLKSALLAEPAITAIGLEIGPWPRMVSRSTLKKFGPRAEIRNQNFLTADFSDATHIFLYLYPSLMDTLKERFDSMLAPGTRVVSCDFRFSSKVPDETIIVPQSKTLSKTLYVYTW